MNKQVKCPKCGKQMDERGMGGHMFAIHLIRTGAKAQLQQELNTYKERIKAADRCITGSGWECKKDRQRVQRALNMLRGEPLERNV